MTNNKVKLNLFESLEFKIEIIKSCDTIGGVLKHLPSLFEKIKSIPETNRIIWHLQDQLDEQNQIAFENLQTAVEWIHDKLHLMKEACKGDLNFYKSIEQALEYNVINLGTGGYFSSLFNEFKHLTSMIVKSSEHHSIFEGWAKINQFEPQKYEISKCKKPEVLKIVPVIFGEFYISEFTFPACIETELDNSSKSSCKNAIYNWKEKIDFSLLELFKFLTILSKYDSFNPLKTDPFPPKSLQELESKQYQASIGYYLSLFKPSDVKKPHKPPLSIEDLIKLIKRFLFMLNKEISNSILKGPALTKKMSAAAKKYCIKELVNHVRQLSQEELNKFKNARYEYEIFELLSNKALAEKLPFANAISKTMIKENAGPEANRILFKKYNIIWHPIPQK